MTLTALSHWLLVNWRGTLVAALILPALTLPALAQDDRPTIPDEERYGRQGDTTTFKFCVDPRDPGWELDRAIGLAIADVLLLEADVHVVADTNARADFNDIYRHLRVDCPIYFGFKLVAEGYPDWVSLTRPYYQTGYVFIAKTPAPARLGDIAPTKAIGATLGSVADFSLVKYNNNKPAAERWRRFPFSTDTLAIEAVLKDTVSTSLVWAPSFSAWSKAHPETTNLAIVAPDPINIEPMQVGAIMLSTETYLRSSVDQAIAALVADGSITRLLAEQLMPGSAPD